MGVVANVSFTKWPKQGSYLGGRTKVCFQYDTQHCMMGTVVRDDAEAPWVTIIRLDDGRFVLATECQYSPVVAQP
jgi:hypothetical protein